MIGRAEALFYHGELIRRFGGSDGVRDEGILDASLNRPFATFGGVDLFPSPEEKAAALLHGIITGHPFVDGNKRVAFLSLGLFLAINGYRLTADRVDAIETMLALAGGGLTEEELAGWIRRNCVRR